MLQYSKLAVKALVYALCTSASVWGGGAGVGGWDAGAARQQRATTAVEKQGALMAPAAVHA